MRSRAAFSAVCCVRFESRPAAAGENNAAYSPVHGFEFGLRRLPDGAGALIRCRASDG